MSGRFLFIWILGFVVLGWIVGAGLDRIRYKHRFAAGDLLQHRLTGDRVLVLSVYHWSSAVQIRLPDMTKMLVHDLELDPVQP